MFPKKVIRTDRYLVFTGGHHTSALAVAKGLKEDGWQILWVGHKRSLWKDTSDTAEYKEVTAAGIPFYNLHAGKLYRITDPVRLMRLPLGFIQATGLLLGFKYKYGSKLKGIITFGGYLGVPVSIIGWLLRLPIIAHEQTVTAGWANKLISIFADKIAVSWNSSLQFYPKSKTVPTGLPFRPEILAVFKKMPSRLHKSVYITGGKQGSHTINEAVFSVIEKLLDRYEVVHQTGSSTLYSDFSYAKMLKSRLPHKLARRYHVYEYLTPTQAAENLAVSEVVVSRSGAHIVQELVLLHTKSVLIPIPWASHNEQLRNAQVLVSAGQAILLSQSKLSGESLLTAISDAGKLKPSYVDVIHTGQENFIQLINSTLKNHES